MGKKISQLPQIKTEFKLINSETINDYILMKDSFNFNQTLAHSVSVK